MKIRPSPLEQERQRREKARVLARDFDIACTHEVFGRVCQSCLTAAFEELLGRAEDAEELLADDGIEHESSCLQFLEYPEPCECAHKDWCARVAELLANVKK